MTNVRPTMCRDHFGFIDSPNTIRIDGKPIGLWWSEQVWGPGNITDHRYRALCARCDLILDDSLLLRELRAAFAGHWQTVHVESDEETEVDR